MNLKWNNWKKNDSYKQVWNIDLPDSGYIVNKDHRKPEENRNGGYKQQGLCQELVFTSNAASCCC